MPRSIVNVIAPLITSRLFYREASLPEKLVHKDIAYWTGADAHPRKHRLDLYLPGSAEFPVLLFVHGGSWNSGDKAFRFWTVEPYANIGRFYATRGVGVAVINYRLQPDVTWQSQVDDVARAFAWAYQNVHLYGGNPNALYLFGHSAGAQLATRAALDKQRLRRVGLSQANIRGVISVSGTPFDLMDEETYRLGMDPAFLERHFRNAGDSETWKTEASSVHLVDPLAPPFLIVNGRWEWKSLRRQNEIMHRSLETADVPSKLVITPWDGHFIIIASLSHPGRKASRAVLEFTRNSAASNLAIPGVKLGSNLGLCN